VRRGGVEVKGFSEAQLFAWLGTSESARYLATYLAELHADAVLFEQHYVDRHFIEDFVHYYARSFNPPDPHCSRLHFFEGVTPEQLQEHLADLYTGRRSRDDIEKVLGFRYLGFAVCRPLAGAAVGRTVLRTYDSDNNRRHYPVVREYRVNIAGLRLKVRGLAYQQQDRGAAVCASTALWSALQQVAHMDGHRTPTPSAITRAAGSPFPASHGLSPAQMATALNSLGYVADLFVPTEGRELFRAKLVSCLLSHLPVVLLLGTDDGPSGHAVTVTGFSEPPAVVPVSISAAVPPLHMKSGSTDVLYVHDDNLGSHAHYELVDEARPRPGGGTEERLMLRRGRKFRPSPPWWPVDILPVTAALVPKPAKLRLPVETLFWSMLQLRHLFTSALPGLALHFGARFAAGVQFRDSLFELPIAREQAQDFHSALSLPRHVGVISVFHENEHILEAVIDVSEVAREPRKPPLLAMACCGVPFRSSAHANLLKVASRFNCPLITGPAAP
jgi:hypothetical protein